MKSMNIWIGYDSREHWAFKVCEYSIRKHRPNAIVKPIEQQNVRLLGLYDRPVDKDAATEFSLTRFLTPALSNFKGWSIYCDCDFLFTKDVKELFDLADPKYAVMVVKHDYTPKSNTKMDGRSQFQYPRKNWSSLILFNNEHPSHKFLDVNSMTPAELHQFKWIEDKDIGKLPEQWNWLVGYYDDLGGHEYPFALHYTDGGPWFEETKDCEYSSLWSEYYEEFLDDLR
jgi:lipopolysaccharide biosynthesis glycosyltransferase